jgi:hypothetical protein
LVIEYSDGKTTKQENQANFKIPSSLPVGQGVLTGSRFKAGFAAAL